MRRQGVTSVGRLFGFVPLGFVLFGLVLLALMAMAMAATVDTAPASAQEGSPTEIRAAHSDKCLGVENAATGQGARVVQQTCTGAAHQQWTVRNVGGAYNRISVAHTGMCLNVYGGFTDDLTEMIQWPCTDAAANDQFTLQPAAAGGYHLVARHSNKCVDIEAGSSADGARAIQYTCFYTDNQRFILTTGEPNGNRAQVGSWGPVEKLPMVPVAASALPDGKVLMWSSSQTYAIGGQDFTYSMIYDPADDTVSERRVTATGHDMFCPGIAHLSDGRILINGGTSSFETTIYDPATDTWSDAADMNVPRGYNATTLTSDGRAFTVGGSWSGGQGNKVAEIWSEDAGWRRLPGIPAEPLAGPDPLGIFRADNHMWLFGWTNDRVFHAGPSRPMHWLNTEGDGSYSSAGNRGNDAYAMNGNAVMFEPGRILTVGGAPAYDNAPATANATVIDITGSSVSSREVASMANRRAFHSSVVLPAGDVLVTGGQDVAVPFSDAGAVFTAELWNSDTERFTPMAPMSVPRTYHSFSLLLPDARVMVGGGGLCGNCATNHDDVQVFTPPYLYNADGTPATRPSVTGVPAAVDLGEQVTVNADRVMSEFALIRMSSATHAVNNDQRRIPLSFTGSGSSYTLAMPTESGVAIPGLYMLFGIDDRGVPSVADIIEVTADQAGGGGGAAITGKVVDGGGTGVGGVNVDLFTEGRAAWLASTTTDASGNYRFDVDAGCFVVTFIASDGAAFDSGQYKNATGCVDGGGTLNLDATLVGTGGASASAGGRVVDEGGAGVAGVSVDLFTEGRASWVRSVSSAGDGSVGADPGTYSFDLVPGCWVLTFVAPAGRTFTDGSSWLNRSICVADGETLTGIDATLAGGGSGAGTLAGTVSANGQPVPGVGIDLFTVAADGSRGSYSRSVTTDGSGSYAISVSPGCWYVTFIAPEGRVWTDSGTAWLNVQTCPSAGQRIETSPILR